MFKLTTAGEVLLCRFAPQWIGWDPLTWGRTVCFAQSTDSNANLIQEHPHRHTQNMMIS